MAGDVEELLLRIPGGDRISIGLTLVVWAIAGDDRVNAVSSKGAARRRDIGLDKVYLSEALERGARVLIEAPINYSTAMPDIEEDVYYNAVGSRA